MNRPACFVVLALCAGLYLPAAWGMVEAPPPGQEKEWVPPTPRAPTAVQSDVDRQMEASKVRNQNVAAALLSIREPAATAAPAAVAPAAVPPAPPVAALPTVADHLDAAQYALYAGFAVAVGLILVGAIAIRGERRRKQEWARKLAEARARQSKSVGKARTA